MFGVDSTITSILGSFLVMLMRHIRICVLFGLFPQSPRALCVCAKLLQSYLTLCNPMDYSPVWAPLSMGFPRQEYWSGLSFPSPGDLPDPEIKPTSLLSPALAGEFFTTSTIWEALPKALS